MFNTRTSVIQTSFATYVANGDYSCCKCLFFYVANVIFLMLRWTNGKTPIKRPGAQPRLYFLFPSLAVRYSLRARS